MHRVYKITIITIGMLIRSPLRNIPSNHFEPLADD